MRLIDGDTINGTFAPCETYTGREVIALLNQQPTAYDVNKVVNGLEAELLQSKGNLIKEYAFARALQIVQEGAVKDE